MKFAQWLIFSVLIICFGNGLFAQGLPASPHKTAAEILSAAKTVFIVAKSEYMDREAVERELVKDSEFSRLGLMVVRDKEEADLILEVYRKKWTTRFTITALDARTKALVASCQKNSFGGDIEPKLAKCFIKQAKAAKQQPTK